MNKRTYVAKKKDIDVGWHFVDASGRVLGRLASEVAQILIGKHKPIYTPTLNVGNKVVVTNASKVVVTGRKKGNKVYNRYTGYPGGLKTKSFEQMMRDDPTKVVRNAVKGMLPKNKLEKERMSNLYIYLGDEHPHRAQEGKN